MPKFIVETSARHVHVTQETLETLFGKGATLTKKKDLSQPGQFACEERVTVVGPKKELANVSILGPVRKADQIELSATDARSIGVAAPIRESGDTAGSGACKLVGPCGEVECSEGVIVAKRHIHMTPADAETFIVHIRPLIIGRSFFIQKIHRRRRYHNSSLLTPNSSLITTFRLTQNSTCDIIFL